MTRPSASGDGKKWGRSYQVGGCVPVNNQVADVLSVHALSIWLEDLHTLLPSVPLLDTESTEMCATCAPRDMYKNVHRHTTISSPNRKNIVEDK